MRNSKLSELNIEIIDGDRGTNYPNENDFSDKGFCLFLNAKNVTKEGFKFEHCQFISKDKDLLLGNGKLLQKDIVLTTRGTVGNIALYNEDIRFEHVRINSGMVILRNLSRDIDTNFLYHLFRSPNFRQQIEKISFGSAQPQLTVKTINNLEVIHPISQKEQRQIATILSTADAVIEKTQAAIAKYKAIKQGMLQDLFTRGIDTTTGKLRPSYQDAPELYKESKLGWIPMEWDVERIDKLCQITTGNKDTQNKLEYGEYPFFVRSQTVEKINSYSYNGEAILTAGDGVGVGKIYHYINGKFDFHQRVYMLYEFEKIITPKYLFYYFSTNFLAEVDRCSAKTTVDSVRMEMIAGMLVPIPNIVEQISIAEKLISLESKLQTEQDFLHKQQQIKAGLMNDLLSGKKKVIVKKELETQTRN
jgi:type I restriction enzyme S subunit